MPVKDHFLYKPKNFISQYYDNTRVVKERSIKYHNGSLLKSDMVIASHEFVNDMIFYTTSRIDTKYCFTFNVDKEILPYIEIHVFRYFDKNLLLDGPIEIHFSGPKELGCLLRISY